MNTQFAVCCYNNESQIWRYNAYTPPRGEMLVKGFGYHFARHFARHFDRHFDRYFDRYFNKKKRSYK